MHPTAPKLFSESADGAAYKAKMETAGIEKQNVRRYAPHCLFFYKGVTTVDRKQKVIHLLAAVLMCVMTAYLIKHLTNSVVRCLPKSRNILTMTMQMKNRKCS